MSDVNCPNPLDPQTIRQYGVDGVSPALFANNGGGQNRSGICYAIEGNTVDRASSKNGRGWCENVSPTLNTQDRHAVIYDESSITSRVNGSNPKYGDPCHTLHTDSRNIVVISIEGNGARPSHAGNGYSDTGQMYTLNTIEQHSVCYSVDCRNLELNENRSGTLQAKESGGFSYNYLNPVLMENMNEQQV